MRLARRLFFVLFMLAVVAGGVHTVMTGTIADALIQGSIRDALAAETLGDMQEPVQDARRYLQLHDTILNRLGFLAPDPDTSGCDALNLKLTAVDLFVGAVAQMQELPDDEAMTFAIGQLSGLQSVSAGVWRPRQALTGAIVFWVFFIATATSGISRLRVQPSRESSESETEGDDVNESGG